MSSGLATGSGIGVATARPAKQMAIMAEIFILIEALNKLIYMLAYISSRQDIVIAYEVRQDHTSAGDFVSALI